MAGAGPVVRADGRREDDERFSRRLEVVIQAPLADQQVHDPRKLRIDGDDLVPVVTSTPCADADGRDILRDIGGDRRVSLDDHHVGCFVRVREVETRNEQLLDVLLKSRIGDRDARHEALAGSPLDRTSESRHPRVARLTEDSVDPRQELRRLERLGDVVGRAA